MKNLLRNVCLFESNRSLCFHQENIKYENMKMFCLNWVGPLWFFDKTFIRQSILEIRKFILSCEISDKAFGIWVTLSTKLFRNWLKLHSQILLSLHMTDGWPIWGASREAMLINPPQESESNSCCMKEYHLPPCRNDAYFSYLLLQNEHMRKLLTCGAVIPKRRFPCADAFQLTIRELLCWQPVPTLFHSCDLPD